MDMNKTAKIAKVLDRVLKVLHTAVLIGAGVLVCVVAVLSVVNAVQPGAVIGENFHLLEVGPLTFELAPEYAPDNDAVLAYVWLCTPVMAVYAAGICLAIRYVRKILQPMAQGQPFTAGVSGCLKKLSYISLALGVVQNVASFVETGLMLSHFRIGELLQGSAVRAVTANYTVDAGFVVVFLVLFMMAHIFAYGAQLQQLSDETL